jgi:ribosomal protein S3AE
MVEKAAKVLTRRRKFIEVDVPSLKMKIEIMGNSPAEIENRTVKMDLTRQLRGKSLEAVFKIVLENEKPVAYPNKIKLMSYFIRRMIRKKISYIEDSFITPSQESMLVIKPFLITRKKVSKAVRRTLRNKAKNWLEDYIAERKNHEIFNEILSNRLQKSLSLMLKKTYPLSLCEIRILEIKRPLKEDEIPKIKEKPKKEKEAEEEIIDQIEEIEREKIKKAESEIKQTQENAISREETESTAQIESKEEKPKKTRISKKKTEEVKKDEIKSNQE